MAYGESQTKKVNADGSFSNLNIAQDQNYSEIVQSRCKWDKFKKAELYGLKPESETPIEGRYSKRTLGTQIEERK